jgi:hypothetical protein
VGDSRALAKRTHLTLPPLRGGPLPLPPRAERDVLRPPPWPRRTTEYAGTGRMGGRLRWR